MTDAQWEEMSFYLEQQFANQHELDVIRRAVEEYKDKTLGSEKAICSEFLVITNIA